MESCGIVERGDNRSRHCPIWVTLKLGSLPIRQSRSKWIPRKPDWASASINQKTTFKQQLEVKLGELDNNIDPNIHCQDPHRNDDKHSTSRDNYVLNILASMVETTHLTIPTYGGCKVGDRRPGISIPGWKTEVKPYKDLSIYWGHLWKVNGRPNTGWIYDNYTAARKQYHYAVLRVKNLRRHYQAERLIEASMNGDVKLLKEMKTIKKGQGPANGELPEHVGGADGEQAIAEMFKESYKNLFNSAPSKTEMEELRTEKRF